MITAMMITEMRNAGRRARARRKALVFSTDILLGIIGATAILAYAALIYSGAGSSTGWSEAQEARTAQDILAVLDMNGTLETLDAAKISAGAAALAPPNYGMRIEVEAYNESGGAFTPLSTITVGDSLTEQKTVVMARRYFLTYLSNGQADKYCVAKASLWLK